MRFKRFNLQNGINVLFSRESRLKRKFAKKLEIMKTYKWKLRAGSKKDICPNCGQRRFVPYVLSADGVTLAGEQYGRCDREQSCGYHKYPNGERVEYVQPKEVQPKEMLRYNGLLPKQSPTCEFYAWMQKVLGKESAFAAINEYQVGSVDNMIIWWQTDRNGVTRTGKIMKYKPDGHRDKEAAFPVLWAHKHKRLKERFVGEELKQCLFGEHLLAKYPSKPVCVVESEKTAVIMSQFERDFIWVATGGSQGIKNAERLQALKGRKVLLIPDNGQYWNWKRVADLYGWEIMESMESAPDGYDILDLIENN